MAVETGYSKTITSGSVFLYDTGDTVNCYKGEPITNQFQVQGTSGLGAAADNAVNFSVQGTVGFVRLGFGQTFAGYTIQPSDVVYKYPFNAAIGGCHYHGNTASIPAGAYLTFTFDYYISPDTNFATGNSTFLANVENYGGGALGGGVNMPNYLKDVWQTVTFTVGPRGGGTGTQAMFLYPGGCGGNIATNGFILFRNPRVYWLPYDVPFVQGTRSTTQAMIDIVGGNTINLVNMTYGANNALSFDGTDDYTQIVNGMNPLVGTNQVTFAAWIYRTSAPSYWAGVISNKVNLTDGISLLINPSSKIFWQYDSTSGVYAIDGGATLATGVWYYIVGVYDNVGLKTYLNGVLNDSANDAGKSIASNGSMNINIGAQEYLGSPASYFPGRIAIAQIYNRALSPSEILSNFNHYKTRFNIT